ncbi:5'/3'-nucleotidase SurE [Ruania albidiflava]|uniref:5'/3'-nucleotidase SurE n=1 Tax=Ruania albidiflava TaxID=366586 RepID=UPI0023F11C9A|nr:5'/3'-nucleotidase SurE [Ruania albidiflava]
MRVLITNDDGIDSAGLTVLAHVAADAGHDVVVAAPNAEYSGFSAGLRGEHEDGVLTVSAGRPPGLRAGIESMAVHASPALIAYAAGAGDLGPRPDMLLSGINLGPNVGPAIMHSATVGAAISAAAQDIPSMATSITARSPQHWETAAAVLERAVAWLTSHQQDHRVLNVNVPDIPLGELKGLRTAHPARFTAVSDERQVQVRRLLFEPFASEKVTFEPDSDAGLLAAGWATVSLVAAHVHDGESATMPSLNFDEGAQS